MEEAATPPQGETDRDARRRRVRIRLPATGLLALVAASTALTLLLLQPLWEGFRVDGDAPPAPRPTGGWAPPAGTARILVSGDSRVQGSTGDYTWRYRLWEHLAGREGLDVDFVGPRTDLFDPVSGRYGDSRYAVADFDTDHAGVWGSTAAEVAERIGREVLDTDPHYLLLLVGVNDLVEGASGAEVLDRTRDIVAAARTAKGDLQVVIGEILPVWGTEDDLAVNTAAAEYNAALPALADQLTRPDSPVVVARTAADYVPAEDHWDEVHPNARGEVKVAAAFADALADPLGLGSPYPRPLPEVAVGPAAAPRVHAEQTADGARVSWDGVPGATRYEVFQRRTAPDPDERVRLAEVAAEADGGGSYEATGLFAGASYEFEVRPLKGGDPGPVSEPVRLEVTADPPPAPEG
ncbi:GDSL-type esterase/lipase family protein, partial [Thermobifida cellulosilytica]